MTRPLHAAGASSSGSLGYRREETGVRCVELGISAATHLLQGHCN